MKLPFPHRIAAASRPNGAVPNPKSETRNPKEIRNPKSENLELGRQSAEATDSALEERSFHRRGLAGIRLSGAATSGSRFFGFRLSDFLRISSFGFRVSLPLTTLALAIIAFPAPAATPLAIKATSNPTEWTISQGTNTLLVYSFAPTKFKPYVKALAPLGGSNILRDAPFDHLHHHALMFAIAVNGLNFWEEISGSGVQKPVESPAPEIGASPNGLPQATIRQTINWLAPQDAFLPNSPDLALLVERRTLTLTVNEATREVALRWKSAFEVGGRTNTVALSSAGHPYFGLGMRFLQELDPLAEHFHADGQPDLTGTKQDLSPHTWSAVSFGRPGAPATIALFDHPSNARSPSVFFSMKRPFAYLSATQAIDKEPLIYHAGDKWQLNYLVTIYPEVKAKDALDAQAKAWRQVKP